MGAELTCLLCGQPFEATCHISRQKYCSDKCRKKYNNAKRYFGGEMDTCPECGDHVEQTEESGRWRRFCSDQCRVVNNRKKQQEKRQNRIRPIQLCPNCGKEFQPEWGQGSQRRFCCDACRIEWWKEYHKANPDKSESVIQCVACGQELHGKNLGGKYCCRACYLQTMEKTHSEKICEWCGEAILTYEGLNQTYCSRGCATAARNAPHGVSKARRRIPACNAEIWRAKLTEAARADGGSKHGQRARLVCGVTSMHTGLDGLIAIIRYQLRCNPYDGSLYVFRDFTGTMLKYLEWDGSSFCLGKRRAQSGSYPWPSGEAGTFVEISDKEFAYLLSKSIIPTRVKKRLKNQEKSAY